MIGPLAGREGNGRVREGNDWWNAAVKRNCFLISNLSSRGRNAFCSAKFRRMVQFHDSNWLFWTEKCKKSLVRPFLSLANVFIGGIANKSLSAAQQGKLSAREALGQINWSGVDLHLTFGMRRGLLARFLRSIKVAPFTTHQITFSRSFSHDEGECEPIWAADISILLSRMTPGHG